VPLAPKAPDEFLSIYFAFLHLTFGPTSCGAGVRPAKKKHESPGYPDRQRPLCLACLAVVVRLRPKGPTVAFLGNHRQQKRNPIKKKHPSCLRGFLDFSIYRFRRWPPAARPRHGQACPHPMACAPIRSYHKSPQVSARAYWLGAVIGPQVTLRKARSFRSTT
jgi:hypothetical protein